MSGHKQLKLLLADDDKTVATIYELALPSYFASETSLPAANHESELPLNGNTPGMSTSVTVCSQGDTAVELFDAARHRGEPFDVVVLDIHMPPGIDGIEAAEQIRSADHSVPIIFVSGFSDVTMPDLQQRIPPRNLLSYIEKPIQLALLAERIREFIPISHKP